MNALDPSGEYRPELLSRRGELFAWGCTLLVDGAWLVLYLNGKPINLMIPLLGIPLSLIAASISLGNWMDRHTLLGLDGAGVGYRNGLRNVRLKWEDIQQVRVLPTQWGKKIQVIGEQAYFAFNTLGEVQVQGKIMGRVGFIDGEAILQRIIKSADLRAVQPPDASAPAGIYYYVRD